MRPDDWCEYGNHKQTRNRGYIYSDKPNGIEKEVSICRPCFAKHILKYYPDGRMAEHIRANPDEFIDKEVING